MKLVINGETKEFDDGLTLLDILKKMQIEEKVMAAAVNMQIVKQDSWDTYKPQDADKLELLDFVGGG